MIQSNTAKKFSPITGTLFFAIFAIAGIVCAYYLSYVPLLKLIDSKNWVLTSCEVISSKVAHSTSSNHGKSSTTYKAEITYQYQVDGKSYTNNAYHFQDFYSSGYNSKQKIVENYPPGLKFNCYFNPRNPQEAVIDREPGLYLLLMLFPLPFLTIGFGGLYYNFKQRKQRTLPLDSPDKTANQIVLKENLTPLNSFLMILLFCLFWNGCVLVMIYKMLLPSIVEGKLPIFEILFSSVFIFFGAILIFGVIRSFLSLFNPRLSMVIMASRLFPGESYQLEYKITGDVKKLNSLSISLNGTETTTYRTDKGTRTNDEIIHESKIYQEKAMLFSQSGIIEFTIPENIMPTFIANYNKIEWTLKAQGGIHLWPDMIHEFKIVIFPPDKSEIESWLSL